MKTAEILHERFNRRSDQIPPARIKGFNRVKLAQLFAELGFQEGAEIGVADGRNSLTLCENIPGLHLHCVDPWLKYPENPRAHNNQAECLELAQQRLAPYRAELIQAMSMEAVSHFRPGQLDFVYIDGHHGFDYVMMDLIEWSKIVRPGGIVAGHDYYRFRWAGVVDAVDAYTKAHQINEWFIDDDRREPSFFWAKNLR